jgi:hypothetical protein
MDGLWTDCDWMALHVDALSEQDVRGRLLARRAPDVSPAPRFFLGRTRHGNLWRIRTDEPVEAARRLSRYAGKEGPLPDGTEPPLPPERIEVMRSVLREVAPIAHEWRGPAYRFPDLQSERARSQWVPLAEGVQPLVVGDVPPTDLALAGFPNLAATLSERQPCFAVVEDGQVRAACFSACGQPGRAFEAGVGTGESHRGRGLALRCVAAWALAVAESGALPLYSTSWENRASRRVAEKLGLELYGEDLHFT